MKITLLILCLTFSFSVYADCLLFVSSGGELKASYKEEFSKHGYQVYFTDDLEKWDSRSSGKIQDLFTKIRNTGCSMAILQPVTLSMKKYLNDSKATVSAEIYDAKKEKFINFTTNIVENSEFADVHDHNLIEKRKKYFVEMTTKALVNVFKQN